MKQISSKIKLMDHLLEIIEMGQNRAEQAPFLKVANELNQGQRIFQNPAILSSKAYRLYRRVGCTDEIATANVHYLLKQLQEYKTGA